MDLGLANRVVLITGTGGGVGPTLADAFAAEGAAVALHHRDAAKAGVIGLTSSLAKELGPDGILVNAVAPTRILTVKEGVPSIPDERAEKMAKSIPLRRLATADAEALEDPLPP